MAANRSRNSTNNRCQHQLLLFITNSKKVLNSLVVLYLCWTHSCQFSHVQVQKVELQPTGHCAATLQELSCQQLQKPFHHTEDTQQTVIHFSIIWHKCGQKGFINTFSTLPVVPVFPLQQLKCLSKHKANQLLRRDKNIIKVCKKWEHWNIFFKPPYCNTNKCSGAICV